LSAAANAHRVIAEQMEICRRISDLRARLGLARWSGKSVALVPTMGALHAGHRSLLDRARQENDLVVLSIFVNPTQFNDKDDLAKYPRNPEADEEIALKAGVDFLFSPSPAEMYPSGFVTLVRVPGVSEVLEGASRPGHFDGVATVVAKLLLITQCDRAYFGLKDYQQLQVVRRMTADLNIPAEIIPCDIVRESDGLAMSSRNVRLSREQRAAAPIIARALVSAKAMADSGVSNAKLIRAGIVEAIASEPLAKLDYAVIADGDDLHEIDVIGNSAVALVAASFGSVRLIDNQVISTHS
jgi:pantoate--beta-alanine ligase